MALKVRLLLWALAAIGVTLAVVFGPFVAGFAFAGGGKRVYLSDAIVIMTSNVGSEHFRRLRNPFGFSRSITTGPSRSGMSSIPRSAKRLPARAGVAFSCCS